MCGHMPATEDQLKYYDRLDQSYIYKYKKQLKICKSK